jgi:hypothetical protein
MNTIFELPHIFVVFIPGAGGNFVSGLLNRIIIGKFETIEVAPNGSSHTVIYNKQIEGDSLSFGTHVEEHTVFTSEEEIENHYLNRIKSEYINVGSPIVTWTHNYSNIRLYKKHFKNARILVIHPTTIEDKLTCVFMHVTKVLLDSTTKVPIPQRAWGNLTDKLEKFFKLELVQIVGMQRAEKIASDKNNKEYKDIVDYAITKVMLRYFGILGTVDTVEYIEHTIFDTMLYPSKSPNINITYSVGEKLSVYIEDADSVLPYSYISTDNLNLLVEKLELVLGRTLDLFEVAYVRVEYTKYRAAQDRIILTEPVRFYQSLKANATNYINNYS